MIRRNKPTQPPNPGGMPGYGAAPGGDQYGGGGGGGYGQPQQQQHQQQQQQHQKQQQQQQQQYGGGGGGYGGGGGNSQGGGGYSNSGGNSGGGYSGYGSSGSNNGGSNSSGGGSGSGGFGVGSGAAGGYGDSPYGASSNRSSIKGKKNKKRGYSSSFSLSFLWDKFILLIFLAIALGATTLYYRSRHNAILDKFHVQSIMDAVKSYDKMEKDKKRFQKEAASGTDQHRQFKNTIRDLEKQNRELKKAAQDVKVKYEASGGMGLEESEKLKAREVGWRKQVQLLQNATSRESKRAVTERFGKGPHHVLFTVAIPNEDKTSTFQVELAPLDLLPHANHLFLQQVYHELWDSTWIYLNGPHVLQAGPQDWSEENAGESLKRFSDTQLDTMSFPEYSADFPHLPWTLGFTGRPGGPDWYINKADNSIPHGPGGQFQHDLEEQADSCFAKVVDGKDTLQRIFNSETYPRGTDYAYFLQEPIEIVQARILEPMIDLNHIVAAAAAVPKVVPSVNAAAVKKAHKIPQRVAVNQEKRDSAKGETNNANTAFAAEGAVPIKQEVN